MAWGSWLEPCTGARGGTISKGKGVGGLASAVALLLPAAELGWAPPGSLALPGALALAAMAGAGCFPVALDEPRPHHRDRLYGCRAFPALWDRSRTPGGGSSWDKVQRRVVWQGGSLWLWRGGTSLCSPPQRACRAGTPRIPPPGDPVWLLCQDGAGTMILTLSLDPSQNFSPRTAWGAGLSPGLSSRVPRCRLSLLGPGFPVCGTVPVGAGPGHGHCGAGRGLGAALPHAQASGTQRRGWGKCGPGGPR